MATAETITLDGNTYTVLVQGWQPHRAKGENLSLTSTGKHDIVYPAKRQQGWNLVLKVTHAQLLTLITTFEKSAAVDFQPPTPVLLSSTEALAHLDEIVLDASVTKLASQFTAVSTGRIGSVKVKTNRVGSPGGTATIAVQGDSSGLPDGTPITNGTTGTATIDSITNGAWTEFTWGTNPSLAVDTVYHFVLETSGYSYSGGNYLSWATTVVASGGDMAQYTGSWAEDTTDDGSYQLFYEGYDVYLVGELAQQTLIPILDGANALYHVPIRLIKQNT